MVDKALPCCPPGSEPTLASNYVARGVTEDVDGLPIYTIGQGEKAIIVVHDIFGVDSGRTKLICDQFADLGYLVVLPNFFRNDSYKINDINLFTLYKIIKRAKANTWEKRSDDFNKIVYPYLEKKGVKRIGMVGFCWGAYMVFSASADERINTGVSFHPSIDRYKETPLQLAQGVKCPQLVLPGGNDPKAVKEGGVVEKALKEKFGDKAIVKTFKEMKHGWVNRGDVKKANVARDVKEAMDLAIDYLQKNL